jgi:hypothetical protein
MTGWNTDGSRSEVYFSLHPRSFTEVDSFFRQRFHLSPSSASIASRQSPQSRAVSGFAQADVFRLAGGFLLAGLGLAFLPQLDIRHDEAQLGGGDGVLTEMVGYIQIAKCNPLRDQASRKGEEAISAIAQKSPCCPILLEFGKLSIFRQMFHLLCLA